MKRFAALLVALCLALSAFALAAEAGVIENKPSYKGRYTAVDKTGLRFMLPDDWTAANAPDGVKGEVYSSGDGLVALTVVVSSGSLDYLAGQYAVAAEDGMLKKTGAANINGRDWVLSTTADDIQHYYQTQLDDDQILSFVFVTAAPGDEPDYAVEMVGSLKKK